MTKAPSYQFRAASVDDVALALHFRRKLFEEMGVPRGSLREEEPDLLRVIYTEAYGKGEIIHYFAFDAQDRPVAAAGALLKSDFPYLLFKPGRYGWIIDVYTEPEHRGQRLATQLLALTHAWLKTKGVAEVKLIAAGPDARRLYERAGYRATWEMSHNLSDKPTYNELIDSHGGESPAPNTKEGAVHE